MDFVYHHCQIMLDQHGGIFVTLFVAGLLGSWAHCTAMCGPFVLAQLDHEGAKAGRLRKLTQQALIPYHLGRMTTYMLLGGVAALCMRHIMATPLYTGISAVLLVSAGAVFIISALPKHWTGSFVGQGGAFAMIGNIIERLVATLSLQRADGNRYVLGVLLGFLPCGLIFASVMVVSTTGNVLVAMIAMMVFTLGTFPALFIVGASGQWAYRKWPVKMQQLTRTVMMVNGVVLCLFAGHAIEI